MAEKNKQQKAKTAQEYEAEIRQMLVECKGECKPWYMLRIRSLAMNLVILDQVQAEILSAKRLVLEKKGSTGQIKTEVNPLLTYYNQLQNTVLKQFNGLGLNVDDEVDTPTPPSAGTGEGDTMEGFYKEAKNILETK